MRLVTLILTAGLAATLPAVAASPPFDTATAERRAVALERTFDAVIEAVNEATVSAQTSGRIIEINFDVDDYVQQDAVIVRIRDREQQAALEAAQARHQEAQASFERMQGLLARDLVSQAEYDKADAALKSARAALNQAREQLEHTVVRAPYSGIVVRRHVELGETANPGQPLMTGVSLEKLRATANVSQGYIDAVRAHGRARVLLPQGGSIASAGVTASPYADPQAHTFRVRIDLPQGQHGVYPGMFAKVAFAVGEETSTVVPSAALAYRSEVTAVYVVEEGGAVVFRQIRTGRRLNGFTEVLAGIEPGERVALDPIRAAVYLKEQRSGE